MVPSHFLNQCWNIVNWIIGNKLQWNLNRKLYIFVQENAFENVVWKKVAIFPLPQCIKKPYSVIYNLMSISLYFLWFIPIFIKKLSQTLWHLCYVTIFYGSFRLTNIVYVRNTHARAKSWINGKFHRKELKILDDSTVPADGFAPICAKPSHQQTQLLPVWFSCLCVFISSMHCCWKS